MLNILLIATDTSHFTNNNYHVLEKELANITNLMVYRKSGHINKILHNIPYKPDFILILNDVGKNFAPVVNGLSTINIPTALVVNDAHRFVNQRKRYITANHIKIFFVICKHNFFNYYPDQQHDKVFFLPQFANISIFKKYNIEKSIDMMMLGETSLPKIYPLREQILKYFKSDPRFVTSPHPGWKKFSEKQAKEALIKENYAREINKAKLFFACGSIRQVVTFKYFEVPACGTLLLAPDLPELKEIGLLPGKHFVDINEENFAEKAEYYLINEQKRKRIIEQGFHFIHHNHSAAHRAKQLVDQIKTIL